MSPGNTFMFGKKGLKGQSHESQKHCQREFCTLVSAGFFYLAYTLVISQHMQITTWPLAAGCVSNCPLNRPTPYLLSVSS